MGLEGMAAALLTPDISDSVPPPPMKTVYCLDWVSEYGIWGLF